ncbi:MAG: NfeD family protein, partial [Gemmatimonadaceae bacterium]
QGVIGGIAFCAIMLLALLLWLVLRSRRARQVSGNQRLLDASGELLQATNASCDGWAQINGERWQVRSEGPLPAGARVRVVGRQGLLLWVVHA